MCTKVEKRTFDYYYYSTRRARVPVHRKHLFLRSLTLSVVSISKWSHSIQQLIAHLRFLEKYKISIQWTITDELREETMNVMFVHWLWIHSAARDSNEMRIPAAAVLIASFSFRYLALICLSWLALYTENRFSSGTAGDAVALLIRSTSLCICRCFLEEKRDTCSMTG